MIHTIVLLGIYFLSVTTIICIAQVRPRLLWRLHPIPVVALFSFVPAIALGLEISLRTELWNLLSAVPVWFSTGLSVLFVVAVFPVRKWIQESVIERTAEAAREFLDQLPQRMMSIEAAESRSEISVEEATERKMQIHRDVDRMSAIDGTGRLLYLVLKLHLLRIGLQIVGGKIVGAWSTSFEAQSGLAEVIRLTGIDAVLLLLPIMILTKATVAFVSEFRRGSPRTN